MLNKRQNIRKRAGIFGSLMILALNLACIKIAAAEGPTLKLLTAVSNDGLHWTKTGRSVADNATSPGVMVDGGQIWLYYIKTQVTAAAPNGKPGSGLFLVLLNPDGSIRIPERAVNVTGLGINTAMDADVQRLPDGRYRMLFYLSPPTGEDGLLRRDSEQFIIASAVSPDGINFTREQDHALKYSKVMDPSSIRATDGTYRLFNSYSKGTDRRTAMSVSSDGVNYNFSGYVSAKSPSGKYAWLPNIVSKPAGGYRLYFTSNDFPINVCASSTSDFVHWTDEGQVLDDAGSMAVASIGGKYLMFYSAADFNGSAPPPGADKLIPLAYNAASVPAIAVRGTNNALYYRSITGTFQNLGGGLASEPKFVKDSQGNTIIFVRGGDNALYYRTPVSGWVGLAGALSSDPEPILGTDGQIYIFARGPGNALGYRTLSQPWQYLGGSVSSNPHAVIGSDNKIYIFVRGGDGAAYYRTLQSAWQSLGGVLASDPIVAAGADGAIYVFARDPHNVYIYRSLTAGWQSLGGIFSSAPSVVRGPDGKFTIFGRGGDNALYFRTLSQSWSSLGGSLSEDPTAIMGSDGLPYIFARNSAGDLQYRALANPSPLAWISLGGALVGSPSVSLGIDK